MQQHLGSFIVYALYYTSDYFPRHVNAKQTFTWLTFANLSSLSFITGTLSACKRRKKKPNSAILTGQLLPRRFYAWKLAPRYFNWREKNADKWSAAAKIFRISSRALTRINLATEPNQFFIFGNGEKAFAGNSTGPGSARPAGRSSFSQFRNRRSGLGTRCISVHFATLYCSV